MAIQYAFTMSAWLKEPGRPAAVRKVLTRTSSTLCARKPRAAIAVPNDIIEVEKRALMDPPDVPKSDKPPTELRTA